MNILTAFKKAFDRLEEKHWDKIYVLVDIHDTILKALYSGEEQFLWYDEALDALKLMTERDDICMILWTSSYPKNIRQYLNELKKHGVWFDYINENPEVKYTELFDGLGSGKLYFNVGIDDKFGFEPETDWFRIYNFLKTQKHDKAS